MLAERIETPVTAMPIGSFSLSRRAAGLLLAAALLPPSLANARCELKSPSRRIGLLELYTSEGCSSCPPADRWLSRLRKNYDSQQVVALAFHVDYWNQLGWRDRFSHGKFTQRQQEASMRNRAAFVYTPQFLLDGLDIRPVHGSGGLDAKLPPINHERARARIAAQAAIGLDGRIELRGTSSIEHVSETQETHIALYENALTTKVAAGENAGKTLQHDFVVRTLLGPIPHDAGGAARLGHSIPPPAGARPEGLGIAIFVQDAKTGTVLQAAAAEGCFSR
ncbi:MAG: DUF1223 domain-containing protein [Betaproteobacteria bacterium]|nr:DUF1223 domain-containing protein [Betaproteobacteria bacterium]